MNHPVITLEYQLPESLYERFLNALDTHRTLSADELLSIALAQYLATLSV